MGRLKIKRTRGRWTDDYCKLGKGGKDACHNSVDIGDRSLLQKCSDYKASKINTFVRTEPPDTQVTKSVIALLLHYGWNKFTIVAERDWSTVARSLQDQAAANNLTVNHYKIVEDRHTCCEERMPCCQVSVWFQLIQETKNMTRSQFAFLYARAGSQDTLAASSPRSREE